MTIDNLEPNGSPVFWGEIAPCEHVAQFYEHDGVLLDTLAGFVGGGLKTGESAIVLATEEHLEALDRRLEALAIDVASAKARDQYISMVAEEALGKFMINQWPDDQLFANFVSDLIMRARETGRRVRAFGELVALLWARGDVAATIELHRCQNVFEKPVVVVDGNHFSTRNVTQFGPGGQKYGRRKFRNESLGQIKIDIDALEPGELTPNRGIALASHDKVYCRWFAPECIRLQPLLGEAS